MRISKTEYYLGIAKAVSMRSTCLRRQYGAVIVKDDEIIATWYIGSTLYLYGREGTRMIQNAGISAVVTSEGE